MPISRMLSVVGFLAFLPGFAGAVGDMDDFTPPEPTETTEVCDEGLIWDEETETCLPPEETPKDDAALKSVVRELAYAGRFDDALRVLDLLQQDGFTLTYRGFLARKMGDQLRAEAYYRTALEKDPDNLLARSYRGQGLVQVGDRKEAQRELSEIRRRGGRGTWPELALRLALERGQGSSY